MDKLNKRIRIKREEPILHTKASESYIDVEFTYDNSKRDVWVPIEYRRTGVSIKDRPHLIAYLNSLYPLMDPDKQTTWDQDQENFWSQKNARVTKTFFDALKDGNWKCVNHELPANRNFARRIQDLKEFGYTIATDTNRYCPVCKKNTTHLVLLRIPRIELAGNGYETWSPKLRKRIIEVLGGKDVYEDAYNRNVLPDHKFSEIRWDDDTKAENPDDMSDDEIRSKYQLLTNQRNQQKREVCRTCFQTNKRGKIFGIEYYYTGSEQWNPDIPVKGKEAEKGCEGCPWYDIEKWRSKLQQVLDGDVQK